MLTVTKQVNVQELSAIYDRIYDIADRLIKKYNPCNIHIKNNKVYCTSKEHTKYRQKCLCCNSTYDDICKYWSNGCTIKCLGCKLFMCYAIQDKSPILYKRLRRLSVIAYGYGLSQPYFLPKTKWLKSIKETRILQIK